MRADIVDLFLVFMGHKWHAEALHFLQFTHSKLSGQGKVQNPDTFSVDAISSITLNNPYMVVEKSPANLNSDLQAPHNESCSCEGSVTGLKVLLVPVVIIVMSRRRYETKPYTRA